MTQVVRGIEGDSIDLITGLTNVSDLTDWSCQLTIVRGSETPVLDVAMTTLNPTNTRFSELVDTTGFGKGKFNVTFAFTYNLGVGARTLEMVIRLT